MKNQDSTSSLAHTGLERANLDCNKAQPKTTSSLLESPLLQPSFFPEMESLLLSFRQSHFLSLPIRRRFRVINQTLCQLILDAPKESFLLPAVLDFMAKLRAEKVLQEPFLFSDFEFWLNHFSGYTEKEQAIIRAKIVGKYLPREEYQPFFPIGMNKRYFGTHFVVAHQAPDVDTMMASFWGFIDAFAAKVGSALHLWALPEGPPDSPITSFFKQMLGQTVFDSLARTNPALSLSAKDLLTQSSFMKASEKMGINSIERDLSDQAVILVNEKGHYLGEWRNSDVEKVSQVSNLFKACLHSLESQLHLGLISLFAAAPPSLEEVAQFHHNLFKTKIADCEPLFTFNAAQKGYLSAFLVEVLDLKKGLDASFGELNSALESCSIKGLAHFQKKLESLVHLFDEAGCIARDCSSIFHTLQELVKELDLAIFEVRNFLDRLEVVLKIKYRVLKSPLIYLTLQSDVEEIRKKMQSLDYLTVVIYEKDGSLFPVGIVRAQDLKEKGLGTASFRDFCNLEEVSMASYLEVISIVDHHKSSLKTVSVPTAIVGDAQSCNVLIAEKTFAINDKFSLNGMPAQAIKKEIEKLSSTEKSPASLRVLSKLFQRSIAAHERGDYFVHPKREFAEYLCFLQAIIDDTDLLTKVSLRDVECIAALLNRLKSLATSTEVEIIRFDDLPRDETFVKAAAQRILRQEDMYALYAHLYRLREQEIELSIQNCVKKLPSSLFLDTKEQNGCALVGQTKLFASNFPLFASHAAQIRSLWLAKSEKVCAEKPFIDLYIQMISTIAMAEEVYQGQIGPYSHQDELWLWIPQTTISYQRLNSFLAGLQFAVKGLLPTMSVEFSDAVSEEFALLFKLHLPTIEVRKVKKEDAAANLAVLRFQAGALNSRKAMITPFLPRLS